MDDAKKRLNSFVNQSDIVIILSLHLVTICGLKDGARNISENALLRMKFFKELEHTVECGRRNRLANVISFPTALQPF